MTGELSGPSEDDEGSTQFSRAALLNPRDDPAQHTSVMLLEAVACLKDLSEIVLRHERLLAALNLTDFAVAGRYNQASSLTSAPAIEVAAPTHSIWDEAQPTAHAVSKRKPLPARVSFLLSGAASVSGLLLAYGLFLR